MKNPKIAVTFHDRILSAKFFEDAVISASDIAEIYDHANKKSNGTGYGIMFESEGHFDVTEDGLEYMLNNPNDKHVIAKVYVIGTKESERKAKLHIAFDHPSLKPVTFKTPDEGIAFLKNALKRKG